MPIENYGNYQLVEKLAMGGMAQLYLARRLRPRGQERTVVLKRILPHLAEDTAFVTMFLDEARIAARLHHPNVIEILDLGAEGDSYFIAMEYIHGEDLRRIGKRAVELGRRMPPALVCRVVAQACRGLDYAHRRTDAAGKPLRIVHRDVSPQNILVGFDGLVKVVDFGIAKAADKATVTASGVIKGKHAYMSPEQALGREIDHRTDVFALGIVLYETLTGTRLFRRATDLQTLKAVSECKVEPPSRTFPNLPPELDAVMLKALSKDLSVRYQRADELADALEAWLKDRPDGTVEALGQFVSQLFADRLEKEEREGRLVPTKSSADVGSVSRKPVDKGGPTASIRVEARAITDVHPPYDPASPLESRNTDVSPVYQPGLATDEVPAVARLATSPGLLGAEPPTLSNRERSVPPGSAPVREPTALYGQLDPLQQKTVLETPVRVATPILPQTEPLTEPPLTEPEPPPELITEASRMFRAGPEDTRRDRPKAKAAAPIWPWWLAAALTTAAVVAVTAKVMSRRSPPPQVEAARPAALAPPTPAPRPKPLEPKGQVTVTGPEYAVTAREGRLFAAAPLERGAQARVVGPAQTGSSQRAFYGPATVVEARDGEVRLLFDEPERLPAGVFITPEEDKLAAPYARPPGPEARVLSGSLAVKGSEPGADVALKNGTDFDWTQCEVRLPDSRALRLGPSVVVKAGATQWITGTAFKARGGTPEAKQREGFAFVHCAEGEAWLKAAGP